MEWFLDAVLVIMGYVLAIYTWPTIRAFFAGAQSEIERLETRLRAFRDAIKN